MTGTAGQWHALISCCMADAGGQWHALIGCYGRRRRPGERAAAAAEGVVEFLPPLSTERQACIRSTPIGVHNKLFVTYGSVFWGRGALRPGEIGFNRRAPEDGGRRFLATTDRRWGSVTNMASGTLFKWLLWPSPQGQWHAL